jgi:carbon-monoxide dehydrogenase large subunit
LLERTVYDRDGQLVTGSLMDYCMPRTDLPALKVETTGQVPEPLGIKGCGRRARLPRLLP